MVSDKSLLEVLKRIARNTWAVIAFVILGVSLGLKSSYLTEVDLKKEYLSIEMSSILFFTIAICGVLVFLVFVHELRKEAKISEPFRKMLEKYSPTEDQLSDLEMFLEEDRNIMNEEQLATDQLSAMKIIVVAPQPLELTSQKVLNSTSKWLERHKRDDEAYIEYWSTNRFGDNPPICSVISQLVVMAGSKDILKKIKCVTVPDELLFIDFTVWVFDDEKIRAFANDKGAEGKDYRLWELHWQTSRTMYALLETIKKRGVTSELLIPSVNESISIEKLHVAHVPHDAIEKLRNESEK